MMDKAMMKKRNVNITDDEIDNIVMEALDHAIETLATENTKAATLRLARLYFGKETAEHSPGAYLMNGFYFGIHEGMRIMAALNGDSEYLSQCDYIE